MGDVDMTVGRRASDSRDEGVSDGVSEGVAVFGDGAFDVPAALALVGDFSVGE